MVFSAITFIGMNLRRLKFQNFYGFSCDGISEDVLCHFFMLYKTRFLISHRPGQGYFKDSSLVFSDEYLFDFPLWFSSSPVKQEEEEEEEEEEKEE